MPYDFYMQYLTNVETLTIPQAVHQLPYVAVQAVLYTIKPDTGRYRLMPDLIATCAYDPPDFTLVVTFTRPVTGYLYLHEHPDVRLARAADRVRAAFREPEPHVNR